MNKFYQIISIAVLGVLVACNTDNTITPGGGLLPGDTPGGIGGTTGSDDGDAPSFDHDIYPYAGQLANDGSNDKVGTNDDIYWEANNFKKKVTVKYNGATASVESDSEDILSHVSGAHVVIDMLTNSVSGVDINLEGSSSDGSLKIYGEKKFKLTFNGVELTSSRGPAINSQCKKRIFVHLTDGTVNTLTDAANYSSDIYYISGSNEDSEDRKGCFFSEGNLIFSGTGSIVVAGKMKHGIVSDGYMYTRPGVTIAVTEAAKNAIHIKGDKTDDLLIGYKGEIDTDNGMGVVITGGLIYTNTSSEAGKGIKTDYHVQITGGTLDLNTSGKAIYDSSENDTSSASGIKADGNVYIEGGEISVKSTGTGGKGIKADGNLYMTGGTATLCTSGGKYVYNSSKNLESSPKGIKADGNITINDGNLNISVKGVSDGSEGMESKAELTINGGEIYIYAYDDAINASKGLTFNGGRIYAYASNNDAIDSNGYLYVNGGLIIASGAAGSEEALDCEYSSKFLINGGTILGIGGTSMTSPSSSSSQRVVIYGGVSVSKNAKVAVLDSSGSPIMTFTVPRSYSSGTLFLSSPSIAAKASYTVSKGGEISGYSESWNGWYDGGTWSDGTTVGSFTSNSVITTVGSTGMGGGMGGGGGRPGGW